MTLKEQLQKLPRDEIVFIGSRSAFFFIGTPAEFGQQCDMLNELWFKSFNTTFERSKTAIETHKKSRPVKGETVTQKITDTYTRRVIEVEVTYESRLAEWEKRLSMLNDNSARAKLIADSFIPFDDRTIQHIYKNIEGDAYIIIVDGYETARFWFKHEYDEFRKKGKKAMSYDVAEIELDDEEDIEDEEN